MIAIFNYNAKTSPYKSIFQNNMGCFEGAFLIYFYLQVLRKKWSNKILCFWFIKVIFHASCFQEMEFEFKIHSVSPFLWALAQQRKSEFCS